jgi:glucosyl-3-phosphoglycerate synthase
MSDFYQTGAIATLHRLGTPDVARLERELGLFAAETPIALVLPCHIREVGTKALRGIARELKQVSYLKEIVVGIDGANLRSWKKARRFFAQLPQKPMLLWNDGPRMQQLFKKLENAELGAGQTGKGRNVWACLGYVLASEKSRMVAVHDCDILTVDRDAQGIEVMGYDEPGGTSSIYCCTFGDQGVTGLQGPFHGRYGISVRDLGEVPDAPVFRTRVDWYVGFAVLQPRSAGRLFNITPAA